MEYLPSYKDSLYLEHHGILGQRWGVRRFQNKDGSYTKAGRDRYGIGEQDSSVSLVAGGEKKSRFQLSDKQKRYLKIGAAVAGTALLAYGAYRLGTANDITKSPLYDKTTGLLKKRVLGTAEADTHAANLFPDTVTNTQGYLHNCAYCSAAYDLRRRGFDVRAKPNELGVSQEFLSKMYDNAEKRIVQPKRFLGQPVKRIKAADLDSSSGMNAILDSYDVIKEARSKNPSGVAQAQRKAMDAVAKTCSNFGPNARGSINLFFADQGGHVISFENDASGKTTFIENQLANAKGYSSIARGGTDGKLFKTFSRSINPLLPVTITRTDNAQPNMEFLKRHCVESVYDPNEVRSRAKALMVTGGLTTAVSVNSIRKSKEKNDDDNIQ